MNKKNKQRLFEVMSIIDPTFKPINEIFGWSEKEKNIKNLKQKIEQAKSEVLNTNIGGIVFSDASKNDIDETMKVRLNLITKELPTVVELLPELFEPQKYKNAVYELNKDNKIYGYVLNNWDWVKDNDGVIRINSGQEKLIERLNSLLT